MLTAVMVAAYVAFIFSVAFGKEALGRPFVPGLSLAIVLGVGIIFLAWFLTFVYSRWANAHYDSRVQALMGKSGQSGKARKGGTR